MTAVAARDPAAQARLLELINAGWTTQAVAAACELELPDRLASGARTTTDLARETGADLDALTRLLRALVTLEVCCEVEADTFALGTLGSFLRHEHENGLRHWALLNGGPLWTRWGALGARVRAGSKGATSNDSTERFRRLEADGLEAALFHGAMTELSRRVGGSLDATLTVPDGALVVDVGGGSGELLATLLAPRPSVRGLLFDLSPALARAAGALPPRRRRPVRTSGGQLLRLRAAAGRSLLVEECAARLGRRTRRSAAEPLQRCHAARRPLGGGRTNHARTPGCGA